MKKICVYTCLTGNYDNLHDVDVIDKNVDFICYTNNKNLKSKTWKIIYVENEGLNDHQLSRKIKMLGTDYIDKKYDISVWQDASVIWKKKPSQFVKKYLLGNFSAFVHNERNSVFEEANEVIRLKRDNQKTVKKHIEFLKKEKFPDDLGLFEMTVFIKKHNNPIVKETMRIWYETYLKYSKRDQLSFMYAVWKSNLKVNPIEMNVWNNEWVWHTKHNYKETLTECRITFGDNPDYSMTDYIHDCKYKIKNNTYSVTTIIPINTNVIEIEVTDVPCIKFSNIKFNMKYDSIQIYNTIPYNEYNIFYNNKGIIRLEGNFKKHKKLAFSIDLEKLSDFEKYNLIEQLGTNLIAAVEDIEALREEVKRQSYMLHHPVTSAIKHVKKKMKKYK